MRRSLDDVRDTAAQFLVAGEQGPARPHVLQEAPQREDVADEARLLAPQYFGRGVVGVAAKVAGERRAQREFGDDDGAGRDDDVVWGKEAVDVDFVERCHRLAEFLCEGEKRVLVEALAGL